ncbi:MAG: M48 family metalloprotease [Candidatus Omnitrophica bacterium]|nr:M48 family metalloprotease [Candidatus Omnitrophota bacterium]
MKKKGYVRVTACITVMSFLFSLVDGGVFNTPASAYPQSVDSMPAITGSVLDPLTFNLPGYLGTVKEAWVPDATAPGSYTHPVIIHIQDAHCNYSAQCRISEIVEFIRDKYGISTVNLEGGSGKYDLSLFTGIKTPSVRKIVSDHFVQQGILNGSEYLAINNPEKIALWGVEDVELYLTNLKVYRDSLPDKKDVDRYLASLNSVLDELKGHIFSPELAEMDREYREYKNGLSDLRKYLSYLVGFAGRKGIDIGTYRNIALLSRSLDLEDEIDFRKADTERYGLMETLKGRISEYEKKEVVDKSIEFKQEKVTQKGFYDYLAGKAASAKIDINAYPALKKYIDYVTAYDSVDKSAVMDEMDALEKAIKEGLYTGERDRALDILSRNSAFLWNIFTLHLSKRDHDHYLANREQFRSGNFVPFIERGRAEYKIEAALPSDIGELDKCIDGISRFYEYSFERDRVFIDKLKFGDNGASPKAAFLVTGGFHSENLVELFKARKIAFVSVLPKFRNVKGYESPYFKLLSGARPDPVMKALGPALARSNMQIATVLGEKISKEVWGEGELDRIRLSVWVRAKVLSDGPLEIEFEDGSSVKFSKGQGDGIDIKEYAEGSERGTENNEKITARDLLARAGVREESVALAPGGEAVAALDMRAEEEISANDEEAASSVLQNKISELVGTFDAEYLVRFSDAVDAVIKAALPKVSSFSAEEIAPIRDYVVFGRKTGDFSKLIARESLGKNVLLSVDGIRKKIKLALFDYSGHGAVSASIQKDILEQLEDIRIKVRARTFTGTIIDALSKYEQNGNKRSSAEISREMEWTHHVEHQKMEKTIGFIEPVPGAGEKMGLAEKELREAHIALGEAGTEEEITRRALDVEKAKKRLAEAEKDRDRTAIVGTLREIHGRLVSEIQKEDPSFRSDFFFVDADEENAFVMAEGTNVYFYRGLVDYLMGSSMKYLNRTLTEDILAFVIAHELSHAVQHTSVWGIGIKALEKSERFDYIIQMRKNAEYDADSNGIRIMTKAGYDPEGGVELLEMLKKMEKGAAIELPIDSSHPYTVERIYRLKNFLLEQKTELYGRRTSKTITTGPVRSGKHIDFRLLINATEEEITIMANEARTFDEAKEILMLYSLRARMKELRAKKDDVQMRKLFAKKLFLDAAFNALLRKIDHDGVIRIGSWNGEFRPMDLDNLKFGAAVYSMAEEGGVTKAHPEDVKALAMRVFGQTLPEGMKFNKSCYGDFGDMYIEGGAKLLQMDTWKQRIYLRRHKKYFDEIQRMAEGIDETFLDRIAGIDRADVPRDIFEGSATSSSSRVEMSGESFQDIGKTLKDPVVLAAAFLYRNFIAQEKSVEMHGDLGAIAQSMSALPGVVSEAVSGLEGSVRVERRIDDFFMGDPRYETCGTRGSRERLIDIMLINFLGSSNREFAGTGIYQIGGELSGFSPDTSPSSPSDGMKKETVESVFNALERTSRELDGASSKESCTDIAARMVKHYLDEDIGMGPVAIAKTVSREVGDSSALLDDEFTSYVSEITGVYYNYAKDMRNGDAERDEKKNSEIGRKFKDLIKGHDFMSKRLAEKLRERGVPAVDAERRASKLREDMAEYITRIFEDVRVWYSARTNHSYSKTYLAWKIAQTFSKSANGFLFFDKELLEISKRLDGIKDLARETGMLLGEYKGEVAGLLDEDALWGFLSRKVADEGAVARARERVKERALPVSEEMYSGVISYGKGRATAKGAIGTFYKGRVDALTVFQCETGLGMPRADYLPYDITSFAELEGLTDAELDELSGNARHKIVNFIFALDIEKNRQAIIGFMRDKLSHAVRKELLFNLLEKDRAFVYKLFGEDADSIIKGFDDLFMGKDIPRLIEEFLKTRKKKAKGEWDYSELADTKWLAVIKYLFAACKNTREGESVYFPDDMVSTLYLELSGKDRRAKNMPVDKDFTREVLSDLAEVGIMNLNVPYPGNLVENWKDPDHYDKVDPMKRVDLYSKHIRGRKTVNAGLVPVTWNEAVTTKGELTSHSPFVLNILDMSVEELQDLMLLRKKYFRRLKQLDMNYRGWGTEFDDSFSNFIQLVMMRKQAEKANPGLKKISACPDGLNGFLTVTLFPMKDRGKWDCNVFWIFKDPGNMGDIPPDMMLGLFKGFIKPTDYMDKLLERYFKKKRLYSRFHEFCSFFTAGTDPVGKFNFANDMLKKRQKAKFEKNYTQVMLDFIQLNSPRTRLMEEYNSTLGKKGFLRKGADSSGSFTIVNELLPENSPFKDQIFDMWESWKIPEYEKLTTSLSTRLKIRAYKFLKGIPLVRNLPGILQRSFLAGWFRFIENMPDIVNTPLDLFSVAKTLDNDFEKLKILNTISVPEERIVSELLPFYEKVIPETFLPQRASRFGATAYILFCKTKEGRRASFREHLAKVVQYMPEPSILRDQILLEMGDARARTQPEAALIHNKLYSENLLVPEKDFRVHDFVIENVYKVFSVAPRKDRVSILLWLEGAGEKPVFVRHIEKNNKISFTTLPEDLKELPESMRDLMIEGFMLGDNGVLDPDPAIKGDTVLMEEYLRKMFIHIFPKGSKEIDEDERLMMTGVFVEVMKAFEPYRRVMVMKVLAAMILRKDFRKLTTGKKIAVLLGTLGPVGIKVAQYLSENDYLVANEKLRTSLGSLRSEAPPFSKLGGFGMLNENIPQGARTVISLDKRLAAASIKQVHKGKWLDIEAIAGDIVSGKIQVPGILSVDRTYAIRDTLAAYRAAKDLVDHGTDRDREKNKKNIREEVMDTFKALGDSMNVILDDPGKYGIDLSGYERKIVYKIKRPTLDRLTPEDFRAMSAAADFIKAYVKDNQVKKDIDVNDLQDAVRQNVELEMNFFNEMNFHNSMNKLNYKSGRYAREAGIELANPEVYYFTDSLMVEDLVNGIVLKDMFPMSEEKLELKDVVKAGFTGKDADEVFSMLKKKDMRYRSVFLSLKKVGYDDRKELEHKTNDMMAIDYGKTKRMLRDQILHQLYVDGVYHADLHQGNVMLTPDRKMYIIDRGNVGKFDNDDQRNAAKNVMLGMLLGDARRTFEGIREMFGKADYPDGDARAKALEALDKKVNVSDIKEIIDRKMEVKATINSIALKVMRVGHNPGSDQFSKYMKALTQAMYLFPSDPTDGPEALGMLMAYLLPEGVRDTDLRGIVEEQGKIYFSYVRNWFKGRFFRVTGIERLVNNWRVPPGIINLAQKGFAMLHRTIPHITDRFEKMISEASRKAERALKEAREAASDSDIAVGAQEAVPEEKAAPESDEAAVPAAMNDDLSSGGTISRGFDAGEIRAKSAEFARRSRDVVRKNQAAVKAAKDAAGGVLAKFEGYVPAISERLRDKGLDQGNIDRRLGEVRSALLDPESAFVWFNAVVDGADKYILGLDNALAVNLIDYLVGLEDETFLEEYILHEALERTNIEGVGLSHHDIIGLTSGFYERVVLEDGTTPLGKAMRDFIRYFGMIAENELDGMSVEELAGYEAATDKGIPLGFKKAAGVKLQAKLAKGVLAKARPGAHPSVVLVEVSPDRGLFDGANYLKLDKDVTRILTRDYGVNTKIIYFTRDTLPDAVKQAKGLAGFAADEEARVFVMADTKDHEAITREVAGMFKTGETPDGQDITDIRLAGVGKGELITEDGNERFSVVLLAGMALGLMEWHRSVNAHPARSTMDIENDVRDLIVRMVDNPEEVETESRKDINAFMKKVLAGAFELKIKKIDYEEIRAFVESETAVLESL